MRIELRILSGARAGQSEVFDQAVILVGRKASNDLTFDAHQDLDVSGMHAEIRERSGRFFVIDNESTNGTFVNGSQVHGEAALRDGDVVAFGRNGPTVEVRAKGESTGKAPAIPRTGQSKLAKNPLEENRTSTTERVALAVREQTRGMRTMMIGSMIGLGALAIVAYWFGHREAGMEVAELTKMVAQSESTTKALRDRSRIGDTSFANALARNFDSLRDKVQKTAARGNDAEIAALKAELAKSRAKQQEMATVDFVAIGEKNDNAIAFLVSTLSDTLYGGTAFSISKSGLMVTNRHNVLRNGKQATKIEIQFANTSTRVPARVVKISDPADEELDLALIQIVPNGTYPTVEGISGSGDIKVGAAVATIGYPLSLELAQQGATVKTTLSAGLASKHILGRLLQIDSYGTHGLSGAPVFDGRGIVIGVVYGGPADRDARVVYAVPSDRLAAFLGDAGKAIIR